MNCNLFTPFDFVDVPGACTAGRKLAEMQADHQMYSPMELKALEMIVPRKITATIATTAMKTSTSAYSASP